jgi:hypothetical protein
VHVGRRDLHQLTRPIHRDGALTLFLLITSNPTLQWTTASP